MDYNEKFEFAKDKLQSFKNCIEVSKFRQFLLLILNLEGDGAEAIMRQLGMGSKGKTVLPYDPAKSAYYTKIMSGLSVNQLTIFFKSAKLHEDFINKSSSKIIDDHLTAFERKNLLPKKFVLVVPEVVDFVNTKSKMLPEKKYVINIESLYINLAEFISSQNLKYIFLLEDDKADLLFTINMAFSPEADSTQQIQNFDIFIDEEKKIRNHTFIRMKNENVDLEILAEIKDLSHAEMFKYHHVIIVPVKSFNSF